MNKSNIQVLIEVAIDEILFGGNCLVPGYLVIDMIGQLHCDYSKVCTVVPEGSKYRLTIQGGK